MDRDGPQPDRRNALLGEADAADALPVFQHGIVVNAEGAELERNWNGRVVFDVIDRRVHQARQTPLTCSPRVPLAGAVLFNRGPARIRIMSLYGT